MKRTPEEYLAYRRALYEKRILAAGKTLRRLKAKSPPKPPKPQLLARILSDNFYLGALVDELALLNKSRDEALRALHATINEGLEFSREWPTTKHARAALILWLMDGNNAKFLSDTVLRHPFQQKIPVSDAIKPKSTFAYIPRFSGVE